MTDLAILEEAYLFPQNVSVPSRQFVLIIRCWLCLSVAIPCVMPDSAVSHDYAGGGVLLFPPRFPLRLVHRSPSIARVR